ncbi:uncharacterized protein HKW66_Vig0241710 [Vigna angularis]|uniref:Uncharacterized protein n=1 Tax=Phaseolus angularis TaxID=3914 RepID=A0A8T0JKT8_PHAAN|nr:uncharacterized protein HKW66_Vig0241710 [Vigna angularis]
MESPNASDDNRPVPKQIRYVSEAQPRLYFQSISLRCCRQSAIDSGISGEGLDAVLHGEFVFATNTSSRVDENSVSEHMNKLKIINEGGTGFSKSDLQNDLRKKLNIKKGRGNNAATKNSTHEVLCQLKNLNVNESVGSNICKSKVDAKPSFENVTTFGKCEMRVDLMEKLEKLNLVKKKEGFVFTGKQDSSGLSFVEFETPVPKVGKEGKLKQKSSKIRMSSSRENLKHYSTTQRWHGEGFVSKESVSQDQLQGSPMDVSQKVEEDCMGTKMVKRTLLKTKHSTYNVNAASAEFCTDIEL